LLRLALLVSLVVLVAASCVRRGRRATLPEAGTVDTIVRVAIALGAQELRFSATSQLSLVDSRNGSLLASTRAGAQWIARPLDRDAIVLRGPAARDSILVRGSTVVLRANSATGFVTFDGRRFRGTATVMRQGQRLAAVNHVAVEQYLRGVVPLEIGTRRQQERAAVAAQAVSARSYTIARLAARRRDATRLYDLEATVIDQAYGGVDVEVPIATEQVEATAGLVLKYGGRVIEAVYSSACGGVTADAGEVWPFGGQPYLRSVSDSIPGGTGVYCNIAPRFAWTAAVNGQNLVAGVDTYLRNYVNVAGRITWIDSVSATNRTRSGRIGAVAIVSNSGRHELAGDRIRFVLRAPNSEILRSTMFEMASSVETGAGVVRLEFRGRGYGHGVGMCQWGAIGRARAGQDFREILVAYFPGTRIEQSGQ
jgi:stage II sporulation protein D